MINTPVEIGTDATSQSEFTEVPHTDEKSTVYRQSLNFGGVDEQMNFVAVSQENEMKELHHANHHN